jgi:hypothetical protein
MPYWVKRIVLGSGEVVAEGELRGDENYSDDTPPIMGDIMTVTCRGRTFQAMVIKGPTKEQVDIGLLAGVYPLRVSELVGGIPAEPKWMTLRERTIRFKKRYKAIVWTDDANTPGKQVTVIAANLAQAKALLEAEHGQGNVFNLHNEEDAQAPRG